MVTRRRSFTGPRAPRKERQWQVIAASGSLLSATEANKLVIPLSNPAETALGIISNNWTASALRLIMSVDRTGSGNAADVARLMWGVTWAGNDAIAAGSASLPNPVNDNADWYAHGAYAWHASGTGARNSDDANAQVEVFSDSMRKQRENNTSLIFIISSSFQDVAVQINLAGRVLFLLP